MFIKPLFSNSNANNSAIIVNYDFIIWQYRPQSIMLHIYNDDLLIKMIILLIFIIIVKLFSIISIDNQ